MSSKRIERVLLVAEHVDSDAALINEALDGLELRGVAITIVSATDKIPERGLRLLPGLDKQILDLEHERLDTLVSALALDKDRVQTKVLVGVRFIELIREVLRGRHDLLIKPAEAAVGPLSDGSVDMKLLRKCPCPLWLLRAGGSSRPRKVLAALGPRSSSAHAELNQSVLDFTAMLAAPPEKSAVHVVHATDETAPRLLERLKKRDLLVERIMDEAAGDLDEQLQAHPVGELPLTKHLERGKAAEAIMNVATACRADTVVMGTVSRTGIAGYFIGNTAERVLGQLPCSVLAVKPSDFVTPVGLTT